MLLSSEEMSDTKHVKELVKEAELYRKQGLLKQALEKYDELFRFAVSRPRFSGDRKFLETLRGKIDRIQKLMREVEAAPATTEVPRGVQDLISKLFSFSTDRDMAALEGALALAKFGQYERAVEKLQTLIQEGILPLVAATNILSCRLAFSSSEEAVSQFEKWKAQGVFSAKDLRYLHGHLERSLRKRGLKNPIPVPDETVRDRTKGKEQNIISISSISVALPGGPRKGDRVEFEITFQAGKKLSVIIPAGQKEVADAFEPGLCVPELRCYSSLGLLNGKGVVSGKTIISSGPRRGDVSLDITITD